MVTMKWPADRIFPTFDTPASPMDAVASTSLTRDQQAAISCLQGIVNKTKPRILMLDMETDEGAYTWPTTMSISFEESDFISIFRKYSSEAAGAVLYSEEKSSHYMNLACTAAAVHNAVAMTAEVYKELSDNGITFSVIEDLTVLEMTTRKDIYNYLYETYWDRCTHRLVISQPPVESFHLRDLCTAAGCAMVFLENRKEEERLVYERFLADMEPGKAIAMGWYTEERSGITTATAFGLSTVPADHFCNPTVYAQDKPIRIRPENEEVPEVKNKVYAAVFVSDGDNIQYNERFMRGFWDRTSADRGRSCINWTISPALVDVAPDILNYYYDNATDKDCFVCGPSGLGYAMPVNTLAEEIEAKNYVRDDNNFAKYVQLSNRYLERAGLRVVTIWDNLTPNQRDIYTKNAPYLHGLTVQMFTEDWETITSESNGKLIKQFTPCYCTTVEHFSSVLSREIGKWDGQAPKFIACQFSVWGNITVASINEMEKKFNEQTGGSFEFVRADDFFRMYYNSKK